jgi:hypothetical protein
MVTYFVFYFIKQNKIGDTCVLFSINILCSQHLLEEMIKFKTVSFFFFDSIFIRLEAFRNFSW